MRARRAALAAGLGAVLLGAPAHADGGLRAQGWWTTTNPGGTPVAPPPPPDVGADDLLLQGGDLPRALPETGVVDPSPAPTAVGALRFQVPADQVVDRLVLAVASGAQAADVRAYPTTTAWAPAQGGPMADAPVPDRSRYAQGELSADGASLVFADVGRLADDAGALSVVLVPGPLDRVVVHRLGPTALVTSGGSFSDCFCPPPPPPTTPGAVPAQAVPPLGRPVALGPPLAVPAAPAPAAAPAPVAQPPAPATRAAARVVADDGRTRLVLALEALLVLVFFGLLGQGPLGVLARLTGQPVEVRTVRGVGRFARERTGAPPRL